MNNKDDKNLNINTGRDFIYTITHGVGAIWFAIIVIAIIFGSSYGIYSITKSNEQVRNLQEQLRKEEEQAKEEAVAKLDIERQLKEEAQARTTAETMAKAEAQIRAILEEKLKEEAQAKLIIETKLKEEAQATATAETKLKEEAQARAEIEKQLKLKAEIIAAQEKDAKASALLLAAESEKAKAIAEQLAAESEKAKAIAEQLAAKETEEKAEASPPEVHMNSEVEAKMTRQTKIVQAAYFDMRNDLPRFRSGDQISVGYRVIEGNRSRVQTFEGVVIKISSGHGLDKTFTVRKISGGIGVERIFPIHSPNIESIKVLKEGKVRRAKLYYLRSRTGKASPA